MAFSGGEELWIFINGQLAVQIFHDPLNSTIPCATIDLSPAVKGVWSLGQDLQPLLITPKKAAVFQYSQA